MQETIAQSSPSAAPAARAAPLLMPLLGVAVAGAALGWALQRRPRPRHPGVRLSGAALLVGLAAFALARRRRRRMTEIEQLIRAGRPSGQIPAAPADTAVRNAERRLDEAVEETFPASDPISVHIE